MSALGIYKVREMISFHSDGRLESSYGMASDR